MAVRELGPERVLYGSDAGGRSFASQPTRREFLAADCRRHGQGLLLPFGTHAPLFYLDAAVRKLRESALTAAQLQAVCRRNAEALLEPPASRARGE